MTDLPHDDRVHQQPLRDQLRKPGGLALGFFGIALALVTIFIAPDWKIPFQWFSTAIIFAFAQYWISSAAISEIKSDLNNAHEEKRRAVDASLLAKISYENAIGPKVIQAMSNPLTEGEVIFLLQPNRLFGQSMLVSIYYEDERAFELFIASGSVSNVQSNGLIQITVSYWEEAHDDIRKSILAQHANRLDRLLVRPSSTTLTPSPMDRRVLDFFATQMGRGVDNER